LGLQTFLHTLNNFIRDKIAVENNSACGDLATQRQIEFAARLTAGSSIKIMQEDRPYIDIYTLPVDRAVFTEI